MGPAMSLLSNDHAWDYFALGSRIRVSSAPDSVGPSIRQGLVSWPTQQEKPLQSMNHLLHRSHSQHKTLPSPNHLKRRNRWIKREEKSTIYASKQNFLCIFITVPSDNFQVCVAPNLQASHSAKDLLLVCIIWDFGIVIS